MKRRSLLFVFLITAFAVQAAFAQSGKQSVKQAASDLEAGVSTKDSISNRESALKWVIETDEVSLIACGGTFGPFVDKKNKNGSDLVAAYMMGMAAFKIDNPTADENAVQLAGVQLALKVYDRLIKEKPKTKFNQVEDLITKRTNGELAAFVAAADCGKK